MTPFAGTPIDSRKDYVKIIAAYEAMRAPKPAKRFRAATALADNIAHRRHTRDGGAGFTLSS